MSAVKEYSRAYLQYLPEERKQAHIKHIIHHILNTVLSNAAAGITSYFYDMSSPPKTIQTPTPIITNEEYLAGFKTTFPDCDVSYAEEWVEVPANQNTYTKHHVKQMVGTPTSTIKVLQKGITIDWS
jgi:hypothetical protein